MLLRAGTAPHKSFVSSPLYLFLKSWHSVSRGALREGPSSAADASQGRCLSAGI